MHVLRWVLLVRWFQAVLAVLWQSGSAGSAVQCSAGLEAKKVLKVGRFRGPLLAASIDILDSVCPSTPYPPPACCQRQCPLDLVTGWPDSHSSSSRSRFSVDVDAAERERSPSPT